MSSHDTKGALIAGAAVFGLFLAYSFVQAPVPGVNEPHYLCKAKHFWDQSYCPRDFFLDSSNTHFVFYLTLGGLTKFLSLESTALIGRCLELFLLASGWTSLLIRLSRQPLVPVLSAMLVLASLSFQSFSGEWIIGGVESKVFAYGFVFWGWSLMLDGRWARAAALLGLGTSFHPVVGGWSLIATGCAVLFICWRNKSLSILRGRRWPICLGTYLLLSLPGLIPALITLFEPSPNSYAADKIQVFTRLGHHLNPVRFSSLAYGYYACLLVLELVLNRWIKRQRDANHSDAHRLWNGIVWSSVLVAGVGLIVGFTRDAGVLPRWDPLLVKLMKFYPFRLVDILLPISVGWKLAALTRTGNIPKILITSACVAAMIWSFWVPLPSRNPDRLSNEKRDAWINVCRWIDQNTPPDALLLIPQSPVSFKWYASRAAYVTYKDCPQDPAGLLEWDRRRKLSQTWASESYENDQLYLREELRELRKLTDGDYFLTSRMGPFESEPIFSNSHYRLYRLPSP